MSDEVRHSREYLRLCNGFLDFARNDKNRVHPDALGVELFPPELHATICKIDVRYHPDHGRRSLEAKDDPNSA